MNPLVVIPYSTGKVAEGKYKGDRNLGLAYNDVMGTLVKDWILFLDQDLLMLNPNWYRMCLQAIKTLGHKAGWITCYTNKIGCKLQLAPMPPGMNRLTENIGKHRDLARRRWEKYGHGLTKLPISPWHPSGFFMLTHKAAWKKVGGFRHGFYGVDVNYSRKLARAGYKVYRMDGLYVYHHRTKIYHWP